VNGQFKSRLARWVVLFAAAAASGCGTAPAPAPEPTSDPIKATPAAEAERARFQGAWKCLSLDINGKQLVPAELREYLWRFEGMQYVDVHHGKVESKGPFSIDPTKSPPWIDLVESTRVTMYGIYRFDGDRLTVCLNEQLRPTSFDSPPGRGCLLMVLERYAPPVTEFPASSLTPAHSAAAKELQGTWQVVSYHSNGRSTPALKALEVPYTFEGDKLITANPFNVREEREYRLDPTRNPKQFDQRFTGGTIGPWIAKGIYEVVGDTLTICYGGANIARPTEFTTHPGDGRKMQVYQRVK
jgi:uncharacterized protein (TIGR03067 family)